MSRHEADPVDLRILELLLEDATLPHKEIGQQVHLTGQAVGARIRKLQDSGVIEGYTVRWNPGKLGQSVHALVTVIIPSGSGHAAFLSFIRDKALVQEAHRISGEGCYWLRVRATDSAELSGFLEELTRFANYKVSLSIDRIK